MGSTQDLPVVIKNWLKNDVALRVFVGLPDVVKGVPWSTLGRAG
jgi:hypothetical protein